MRVIKFRAWDKVNKTYTYVTLGDLICGACTETGDKKLSGNEQIWEQYTGLKDKNGKEIWEGDIVYCSVSNGFSWGTESFISEVCIDETGVRFRQVSRRGFLEKRITQEIVDEKLDTFEVMGNIHDNPELLKEHRSE